MDRNATNRGWIVRATLALCAIFSSTLFRPLFAQSISGHIAAVVDDDGRRFFVNAGPPAKVNPTTSQPRPNIYPPAESYFTGHTTPSVDVRTDAAEDLARQAADSHTVRPAHI